jgi:O-antigen/teichoic acid export membrane protein
MPSENNKRIAKNTLFLYTRNILIMAVSLFTVRIVLKALGAEDYGIQNVVGGIVAMLSFFSSTMVSASMRFFAFEIGRKDYKRLNQFFKLSVFTYLGLGLIVLLLAETVGLWFIKTHLTIPANRMEAAMWVYQFSIVSFILHMFVVPFNSMIIAHEKMNIYAYVSIVEAILKLVIVYLLLIINADKLKVYSVLHFIVTLIISLIYITYSTRKYKECKLSFFWDNEMFKELIGFSGWSLFGALSGMIRNQGINILLNIFFNPVVNAARAIAFQINSAINLFVTNFYQAVRPQITKQYAAGENQEMMKLVFRSSKFCYYLILLFAVPILIETPYILNLWLGDVPEYTILFTRLIIITTMIESISYPLMTAVSATGKIKWFQIFVGGLLILNLPISYVFLKLGYPPQITMYIAMSIAVVAQIGRIMFMIKMHNMLIVDYLKEIILIILLVTILSFVIPYILFCFFDKGLIRLIILTLTSILSSITFVYSIGITKKERFYLNKIIKQKIRFI